MDGEIILVKESSYYDDSIGQCLTQEEMRKVWASIQTVTRSEWWDAGQRGLQPQLVVTTPMVNYEGEEIVQIGTGEKAKRYGVYRAYFPDDSDMIELYLEGKAGEYAEKSKSG